MLNYHDFLIKKMDFNHLHHNYLLNLFSNYYLIINYCVKIQFNHRFRGGLAIIFLINLDFEYYYYFVQIYYFIFFQYLDHFQCMKHGLHFIITLIKDLFS